MTQYNHNKAQVQVVVTLKDGRQETHLGANKVHIDPNTRGLYVKINDGAVAVYASNSWESAVTHTYDQPVKEATRLVAE